MASKKTKRIAVLTAVSASLMMGGAAAFAHENETVQSCQWPGKGQGKGAPSDNESGQGYSNGWHHRKCKDHDDNCAGNPGGNPGGNPSGDTTDEDHNIDVNVTVEVDLPDITAPDAASAIASAKDKALSIAHQTVTLAESDVAGLMAIVESAGEGATSLVDATTAQAGVSVNGTSGSGTVNVSSGAVGGATTLGSGLTTSTLDLLNANVAGAKAIVFGTMVSML